MKHTLEHMAKEAELSITEGAATIEAIRRRTGDDGVTHRVYRQGVRKALHQFLLWACRHEAEIRAIAQRQEAAE